MSPTVRKGREAGEGFIKSARPSTGLGVTELLIIENLRSQPPPPSVTGYLLLQILPKVRG